MDGCRKRGSCCGQLYLELVETVVKHIFVTEDRILVREVTEFLI